MITIHRAGAKRIFIPGGSLRVVEAGMQVAAKFSIQFDGSDDYISLPGTDNYDSQTSGTFSVWVKRTATGVIQSLLSSSPISQAAAIQIGILTTNAVYIQRYDGPLGAGANHAVATTSTLGTSWTHVLVTASGSAWTIYFDGVSQPLSVLVGSNNGHWFANNAGYTNYVRMGNLTITPDAVNYSFGGYMADPRLYSRVLSGSDITALSTGGDPATNDPAGWWKLDEGSGITATDSGSGGNNGTLTNGPTWSTDVPAALA